MAAAPFFPRLRGSPWRYAPLASPLLILVFLWQFSTITTPRIFPLNDRVVPYIENGVSLPTHSSPLHCDLSALPAQVFMAHNTHHGYAQFLHGLNDYISQDVWQANGTSGWEERISLQMHLYMIAIKSIEPSRETFLDLGANIGSHTLDMSWKGWDAHAFEPTRANWLLMQCSLAFSFASLGERVRQRVRVNAFGVGDEAREVCMNSESKNMGNSVVASNESITMADCLPEQRSYIGTLGHYYQTFLHQQRSRISVLKINVQGFEIAALRHATRIFDSGENAPVAVSFEYDPVMIRAQGYDPLELGRYLWDRGYSIWSEGQQNPISRAEFAKFGTEPSWGGGIDLFAVKNEWKALLAERGHVFDGGRLLERRDISGG